MKLRKILASIAASAAALAVMAVSVCAYDIDKDFKTTWSVNTTIPGSEFADVTTDSVITFTYTADASLAEKDGHNYWVIKPMFNDSGWPLIDDLVGVQLSEGKDTYLVDVDKNQVSFSIPAETLEKLQVCGMALMGHGVKLESMSISNDKSLDAVLSETPNYSPKEEAPAETAPASDGDTTSTKTGNTGAMALAATASLAAAAAVITRRK